MRGPIVGLSDEDYRELARFRAALRGFLRQAEEAARDVGLTPAQHQLLLAIRGFGGPGSPSPSDLADALQVSLASAAEAIDRCVEVGWLVKAVDPEDGRRRLITLTLEGRRRLDALYQVHRDEFDVTRQELLDSLGSVLGDRRARGPVRPVEDASG